MKYIPPKKLKVLVIMFFVAAAFFLPAPYVILYRVWWPSVLLPGVVARSSTKLLGLCVHRFLKNCIRTHHAVGLRGVVYTQA